ncbi:MAG TPA: hypothetical protein VL068_11120 [Microthrixaceae bacterium]|nr:hypothetical protein [Microthrixaceae bacterium]
MFALGVSGFSMFWPAVVNFVGLIALGAWGVVQPSVRSFIERRCLDLLMVASVTTAAALAVFSTSIYAYLTWVLTGSLAFLIAVFGLFTIARHPAAQSRTNCRVRVGAVALPAISQPASMGARFAPSAPRG